MIDQRIGRLFSGTPEFRRLLADLPLTALDIGARRGFAEDLLPLAPAVDAIGFEPDADECARLNAEAASKPHAWRSLRFVPVALGPGDGEATLHLYRQRGCSSLLEAVPELAAEFSRGDDYVLEGTMPVGMMPLDGAATAYDFCDAAYMKIDVQGFERALVEARSGVVLPVGPRLHQNAVQVKEDGLPYSALCHVRSSEPRWGCCLGCCLGYCWGSSAESRSARWRGPLRIGEDFQTAA